jgi:hypothetical protein
MLIGLLDLEDQLFLVNDQRDAQILFLCIYFYL